MPKLHELGKRERTDICRTIARAAHDCLAKKVDTNGCVQGGTFDARVYKAWSELGVIEDDEFYGNSFSPKRVEVLKGFEKTYEEALMIGTQYDEMVAPLADVASDFALKSEALVRMWCIARFVPMLMSDGPFADLRVTMCVAEDDDDNGAEEEQEATTSNDEDESDDSIVASSSDEDEDNDDASGSGSGSGEEEEEEGNSDIEEVTPEEAEPVDGPRRKKVKKEEPSDSESEEGSGEQSS
jgi:hypothetical protein